MVDITKNSLEKLNDQMKEENDSFVDSSDSEYEEPNFLIENIRNKKPKDKFVISAIDLYAITLAQRELDLQRINRLQKSKYQIQSELDNLSTKNHYMKLDLSNSNVNNEELKVTLSSNNVNNKELMQSKTRIKYILYFEHLSLFICFVLYLTLMNKVPIGNE